MTLPGQGCGVLAGEFDLRFPLEHQPQAQLDFAFRKCRGKTQRLARRQRGAPMNVERRETGLKPKQGAHFIVHACVVGVVGSVEALGGHQQRGLLKDLVLPADADVEVCVTRTQPRIAASANRALVGCMVGAVDLSTGKEIERMPAVVREDRSQLETSQEGILFPRAVEYAANHDLMTLVER